MFIQHNLLAENANRQLNVSSKRNAKTTEKLSSGYRINRAADDAAGLSISEKMRRQIRGLHQTVDNISEGVGYVQTAEGALNEVHDMLQRMNELAVKAANGTNTEEDRAYIDSEVQALKDEMDRIFRTTTFNERKIWEPGDRKLLGYETVRAVSQQNIPQTIDITNENYGVLPGGSHYSSGIYEGRFHVLADEKDGVKITWKGYNYDGTPEKEYETYTIDWDTLKKQNYSFEMSDYFNKEKCPDLFDGDKPVFNYRVAFSPAETSTINDIAYCINDTYINVRSNVSMTYSWEDTNNTHFSVGGVILHYAAAYADRAKTADGHDFDAGDDAFIEPIISNNTNLKPPTYIDAAAAIGDKTGWEFSFEMKGLGQVIASSASISYSCSDRSDGHKGLWWYHPTHLVNGKWVEDTTRRYGLSHSFNGGTLADVMGVLTGNESSTTPGILNNDRGGCNADANGSGSITLHFNLDTPPGHEFEYTNKYGNKDPSRRVGSFSLSFSVRANETEDQVFEKIKAALNNTTVLDFATSGAGSDRATFDSLSPRYKGINAPIYGSICGFYVQAGTEGGQHISVQYEALSTLALGIGDTNTLTQESAGKAIDEIKGALQMVSEQRSTFGAYQNRIEHERNINANVEENTQAAESRIRDADLADLMMEYSINNILMQAGTSMLTQANQSSQSILELLQ